MASQLLFDAYRLNLTVISCDPPFPSCPPSSILTHVMSERECRELVPKFEPWIRQAVAAMTGHQLPHGRVLAPACGPGKPFPETCAPHPCPSSTHLHSSTAAPQVGCRSCAAHPCQKYHRQIHTAVAICPDRLYGPPRLGLVRLPSMHHSCWTSWTPISAELKGVLRSEFVQKETIDGAECHQHHKL